MKKIAVVGSGISGLISAYTLQEKFAVTLFEAGPNLGGHTATVDVECDGRNWAIDTGFIVFNNKTYPNFIRFLQKVGVEWLDTEMSFSVSDRFDDFEYNGNNLNSLFAQRGNLLKPSFYRFLAEIMRFNKLCKQLDAENAIPHDKSLGDFLLMHGFSERFQNHYLLPMAAAIWSASYSDVADFTLEFFIKFFNNHGLLNINDRPQWHVVRGGSREYVRALHPLLKAKILTGTAVQAIKRKKDSVSVETAAGDRYEFDEVVLACHSDQALALLADATSDEKEVLGRIAYQNNSVVLHTDTSLLPRRRLAWASWNYLIDEKDSLGHRQARVSYNMNILQRLQPTPSTFVVTLNADELIDSQKVLGRYTYAHPVFGTRAEAAKKERSRICGVNRTHFCGAYWYNGFHEDGVRSALDVASRFGVHL